MPNDPKFDIRGISIQMTDLWADAGDNGKLDTIPAEIFKGNDTLNGSPFADVLFGFDGDDKITGGGGRDEMNGGDGRDTFFFLSTLNSTKQASGRDTIFKFDRSDDDEIDLTAIDAKVGGINNEFKFIGKKDFHDKKGELRYTDKHGDILIQGDTNGDGKADFAILLDSVSKLKVSDFEL